MSIQETYHKVYMFKNDCNAMCAEISMHQNIETGGNLFGQWTTSGSAVIHVVLGPGERCRRTTTSFDQDSEYMKRVKRFVNDDYMLCHIGEWRSHHSLSLNKPSADEEHDIKRIFPQGMSKFLVIIANIKKTDTVELSPYFFTDGGTRYEKAECAFLGSNNPFSTQAKILAEIEVGAERKQHQRNETYRGGASLTSIESSQNAGSNSQLVISSPRNTGSSTQRHDGTTSTHSQVSSTSGHTKSPAGPPNPPAGDTTTNNPPGNGTVQDQTANNENEKATTKEVVMKDTYDELEKHFGEGKVEMERTRYDDINMIFEHESYHWMLRFPKTFPDQPAQLFRASMRRHLSSSSPCSDYFLEKPLTNRVNILLSIKKNCRSICNICESITKEKLTKPADAVIPTTPADVVKELSTDIQMTLSIPLSFAVKAKNDGSYRIEFEHSHTKWSIEIPAEFPDKPAEVYKQEGSYGTPQKKTLNDLSSSRHKQKLLISSDLIMLAIRSNCCCSQCYKAH